MSPGEKREIEVLLSPGARVRLRVANGAMLGSVGIFQDGALVSSPDLDTLATASITVPVGELMLRAYLDRGSCEKIVNVSAGEERVVELP
jgi:hypothetical protein